MTTKTKTQDKARKSFDYACRQASKCRHEKCQISCYFCSLYKGCEIHERMERARAEM